MLRFKLIVSLIFLIVFSCENNNPANDDFYKSEGKVSLSIDMTQAPSDVVGLKGQLSRGGFEKIDFEFVIVDNQARVEIDNLIRGEWKLSVQAFDDDGKVLYEGSTNVNVVSGQMTTVHLHLDPTTGGLRIIVTWGERPFNPVAYFPFLGNALDKSGNGNNGNVSGANLTEDRYGNPNSAYQFDGIDDYINIGNKQILKPQFPISITAWINIESFEHHNPIYTNNFDDMEYFGFWMVANQFKQLTLVFGNGGLAGPESRRGFYTKGETLRENKWIHVAGIMYGPEEMEIYINGKKVELETTGLSDSTTLVYNDSPASIGRTDGSGSEGNTNHFHGKIDELYIFDYAISEEDIASIYESDN